MGKDPPNVHAYGLDIWWGKGKVLNIEWNDGETIEIVSFRRGSWEAELLALAETD